MHSGNCIKTGMKLYTLHAPRFLLTFRRKDAIISSFNLNPRSFRPVVRETAKQIHITIHRETDEEGDQSSRKLLGFIRFNRKAGSVELTNFQAKLERKNLFVGMSTKRGHDKFAGCHGEGFKLAAMVMRREGHYVRFAASEYYWNFSLRGRNRSHLACRLSPAKETSVEAKKQEFAARSAKPKFKRGLTSNIWEDVTVKVGKARGDGGVSVSEEEFRSWLEVTIDLDPPSLTDVIQTAAGDLILDARFGGHIYLKGLRIEGHVSNLAFGYNLAHGTIGRDRDRLKTAAEEDEMLNAIWEQAILTQGPDSVDTYIKLLHDREDCSEVGLTAQKLQKSAAQAVWARLKRLNPYAFFYPQGGSSQTPSIDQVCVRSFLNARGSRTDNCLKVAIATIKDELNKEPVAVSSALWELLRKFSLVRTLQEERRVLFVASKEVVLHPGAFGAHIVRALKASLALHPRLRDWDLRFVDGGGTELDMVFSNESRVLVHVKWLQFQTSHRMGPCEALGFTGDGRIDGEAFFCDHVVEELFESLLGMSGRGLSFLWRRASREQLRLMPRLVQVAPTKSPNELEVRWIGNEGGLVSTFYNRNIRYLITLHRVTSCLSRSAELLYNHRSGMYL